MKLNFSKTIILGILFLFSLSIFGYRSLKTELPTPEKASNTIDHRPVKKILFIGNSRTYENDLPAMVKNMADSTTAPFRYEVTMHALGGHNFQDHQTNPAVHKLLERKWDYVVLQGASPENSYPDGRENFLKYGQKLIEQIQKQHSQPILFTAWTYDQDAYDLENEQYLKPYYLKYSASYQEHINHYGKPPPNRPAPETFFPLNIDKHYSFIQEDYRTLSTQTHTPMVNVGEAFKQLSTTNPHFSKLTTDGNHPNLQGSYLAAVMFYTCFSKTTAQSIDYIPSDLSESDAKAIRLFIDHYYPDGTCLNKPN